jgi:hypothetical protein
VPFSYGGGAIQAPYKHESNENGESGSPGLNSLFNTREIDCAPRPNAASFQGFATPVDVIWRQFDTRLVVKARHPHRRALQFSDRRLFREGCRHGSR